MAPDTAENWWAVGQIVGAVFGGIALTFLTIYQKAKKEGHGEDVVQKSIGAAFVDRSAAGDLARIANNTDKMVDIMENREKRFHEGELLRQLEEKLLAKRKKDDEGEDH